MRKLVQQHSIEELNIAARKAKTGRVARRILMIRDVAAGVSRTKICEQYSASTETLSLWIQRYNAEGLAGLEDRPHRGPRCKLSEEQRVTLRERLLKQPDPEKDKVVRWRVCDVQKLLFDEFQAVYKTESGVSKLMKSLGIVRLTTRPSHPKKNAQETEDFKKNSPAC